MHRPGQGGGGGLMAMQRPRSADGFERLEAVILEAVAAGADQWFPTLQGRPEVSLRPLSMRPRCSLYTVRLATGGTTHTVLAKVRRGGVSEGEKTPGVARPRLRSEQAGVAELTALEYAGLRAIHQRVGSGQARFGSVRPLDHLPEQSTILMDFVGQPTLRARFIAESRLAVVGRSARRRPPDVAWHNAGAWLRGFHDAEPMRPVPARQQARDDVLDRFAAFGDFLGPRVGAGVLGDTAIRAGEAAADVLPRTFPMAVGHGDFVVRNMFADERGRITVFDPMPRWLAPRFEDLCRFLVGMRLLGLQLHSRGLAYGQSALDHRESLFVSGYYGAEPIPRAQMRSYQLLILLDKWSALVDTTTPAPPWRSPLRVAALASASRYIGAEARRLLRLLGY